MKVVGVSLGDGNKVNFFDVNDCALDLGIDVIVDTDKGLQFGTVVSFVNSDDISDKIDYKKVVRVSTKNDYKQHLNNLKDAKKAILKCNELISLYKLNMHIVDAVYTFAREQLIFRFVADERVDFRQLARDLGTIFKTRIELRQIGIRDKAREIGGIGPCGRALCCSKFLNEFDSVFISMAKNQMLSLKFNKLFFTFTYFITFQNFIIRRNNSKFSLKNIHRYNLSFTTINYSFLTNFRQTFSIFSIIIIFIF